MLGVDVAASSGVIAVTAGHTSTCIQVSSNIHSHLFSYAWGANVV